MSAIISRESHSGSHRGSSCHFCEYGKNTLCEPCTHPRHGPFAKIGMPCGFYKHLHQEPIGRKNAKKRAKRIQEQQDCACGAVSTDTQQVSKPEEEATQKALEATIAKLEMELAELKAKQ